MSALFRLQQRLFALAISASLASSILGYARSREARCVNHGDRNHHSGSLT
jgi:hypothetical protein